MERLRKVLVLAAIAAAAVLAGGIAAQEDGKPVLAPDALFATPVGGLERTKASAEVVPVSGQGFAKALQVKIGAAATNSNVTQLTLRNAEPVKKGDALLASLSVRGAAADGKARRRRCCSSSAPRRPGQSPSRKESGRRSGRTPGSACRSLHRRGGLRARRGDALPPVRVRRADDRGRRPHAGGLRQDEDRRRAGEPCRGAQSARQGDGAIRRDATRQTMMGFGGNFCQPRYGATEPDDAVGRYNLENLHVVHAQIGIPLNNWAPEPGVYKDEGAGARRAVPDAGDGAAAKSRSSAPSGRGRPGCSAGAGSRRANARPRQVQATASRRSRVPGDRARQVRRSRRLLLLQRAGLRRQLQVHAAADGRVHPAGRSSLRGAGPQDQIPDRRYRQRNQLRGLRLAAAGRSSRSVLPRPAGLSLPGTC